MPGVAIFPTDPGRGTCPRALGAARGATASGRQNPGRPLPDLIPGVCQVRPQAPSGPRPSSHPRPGTGQPRRIEAAGDNHAGQTPGVQQRGPGPGPLSPALQLTSGGGVVGSVAPRVLLPPGTRDLARRPPPGLRREEESGRAGAGRGGDMEEDSVAAELPLPGRAARRARGDGDVISPQPSPAPRRRRRQPRILAGYRRFGRACRDLAARCFPLRWGSPKPHLGGEPRVPRVLFYVKKISERGRGYLWSFRFAERVPNY